MWSNPTLVIFLTLAVGYYIGNLKFGKFNLGAVTATLLFGVAVVQQFEKYVSKEPNHVIKSGK